MSIRFSLRLLLFLAAVRLEAQLATTEDGSVLYFSSPARLVGSSNGLHGKTFRWTETEGVKVVAEFPKPDPAPTDGCQSPDFYQFSNPSVSSDGSVLAYTASRPVERSRYCPPGAEGDQAVIVRGGREFRMVGLVALSSNGRYAVSASYAASQNRFHAVTDVSTGFTTTVVGAFDGRSTSITDEGAVVSPLQTAGLLTDRNGTSKIFPTRHFVDNVIINRTGTTMVYSERLSPGSSGYLGMVDVATGSESELPAGHASPFPFAIHGSAVFYSAGFSGSPAYVTNFDGTVRKLTAEPNDFGGAVLSGDGRILYGSTGDGRVLRVDVASGETRLVLAPRPVARQATRVGFQPQSPPATVASIGSLVELGEQPASVSRISVCGKPAAMVTGRAIRLIRFAVPWDAPEGPCQVLISNDQFEHGITIDVRLMDPKFIPFTGIYHADFSRDAPAVPGEVMITHMSGLGPVDADGRVSPEFRCDINGAPAEILYAGISPGLPGFQQINFRVPASAHGPSRLTCGFADPAFQDSTTLYAAP